MNEWKKTTYELPPENTVVCTKISDKHGERNFAKLKRRGNLWFFDDDSMYVYYTPTHWREVNPYEVQRFSWATR